MSDYLMLKTMLYQLPLIAINIEIESKQYRVLGRKKAFFTLFSKNYFNRLRNEKYEPFKHL